MNDEKIFVEKNVCLWVSRHTLTDEQRAELNRVFCVDEIEENTSMSLGNLPITSEFELKTWVDMLNEIITKHSATMIAGVWAVPILPYVLDIAKKMPVLSAWNVQRSDLGQKPTFLHYKFINLGKKPLMSKNWAIKAVNSVKSWSAKKSYKVTYNIGYTPQQHEIHLAYEMMIKNNESIKHMYSVSFFDYLGVRIGNIPLEEIINNIPSKVYEF